MTQGLRIDDSTSPSDPSPHWRQAVLACAGFTIAVAAMVLFGWWFDVDRAKRIAPGLVAMNPLTALCFVLSGTALAILARHHAERWRLAARLIGLAVLALGLARGVSYLGWWDAGLDQLLFASRLVTAVEPMPNRMAPNTAVAFLLVGVGLILLGSAHAARHRLGELLFSVAGILAVIALLGYLFRVDGLYGVGEFIPMALHSALAFAVLCAGALTLDPSRGALAIFTRRTSGALLARRLAPSIIIIPVALGWLRVMGQRQGLYGTDFGASLSVIATIGLLTAVLWWTARLIDKAEEEHQRTRRESERNSQHLAAIVAHSSDAIISEDLDGRITSWNTGAERLYGYAAREVLGKPGDILVAPDRREETAALLDRARHNGRIEEVETIHQTSDGRPIDVSMTVSALRDPAGEVVGISKIARDIRQRKRLESNQAEARRQADEASRAKSAFLANMSHEIRTPLNGLIGMADLLTGTELTERQSRYVRIIKSSAATLNALVCDVLDLSKIEAGKLDLECKPFELGRTIEDAMVMLAQKAGQKGLETALFVDPAVPDRLVGDADRLRQIVINLVNNAIKFTDHGSVMVRVMLEEAEGEHAVIRFTVTDTGIGISDRDKERLFQVFTQLDTTPARRFGGTGLGLAISRQLVELMGGQIGVEGTPGEGSTFWFTVTLQVAEGPPSRRRADPRGLRVLAVDDNGATLRVLEDQLGAWGMDAETAGGGDEAITMLRESALAGLPFRIVIVDKDMPGMDGVELARVIRADETLRGTVLVILLSVESELDDSAVAALGFHGYMTKPVRQSQLFDTIMTAISRAEAAREREEEPIAVSSRDEAARATPARRGAKILLVEDNEVNQIVASEILTQAGYECHVAADGCEGVEAALRERYDIVLMDCQMPNMDGFDATRAIRQAEASGGLPGREGARLPIVALTANAVSADRDRGLAAGMDGYVAKPIDAAKLVSMIEAELSRSHPVRQMV